MRKTFHSFLLLFFLVLLPLAFSSSVNSATNSIPNDKNSSKPPPQANSDKPYPQNKSSDQNNIKSGQLSFVSNLLTNAYQQLVSGQPSPQNSQSTNGDKQSLIEKLKSLQKDRKQQPNNQNNTSNSSNIDNGKNNKINGTQNVIHAGDDNQINGFSNKVNGSRNSISGQNDYVVGDDNIVMDSPLPMDITSILSAFQAKNSNSKGNAENAQKNQNKQDPEKKEDKNPNNAKPQDKGNSQINQSNPNSSNQTTKKTDNDLIKSIAAKTFNLNVDSQSINQQSTPIPAKKQSVETKPSTPSISQNPKKTNVSLGEKYEFKLLALSIIFIMFFVI